MSRAKAITMKTRERQIAVTGLVVITLVLVLTAQITGAAILPA